MICIKRHSSETRLSAMRGVRIFSEGAGVSPASSNSLVLGSKSIAVTFIRSRLSSLTRLTTNSPCCRTLFPVSLRSLNERLRMAKATTGGASPNTLNNENGAAFGVLSSEFSVETQAIGRGVTVELSSLYRNSGERTAKSNCILRLQMNDPCSYKSSRASVEARQTGQAGDRARRSSGTELVCRLREYDFRNVNHDVYDRIWHSR